jgi:hypothetical protein
MGQWRGGEMTVKELIEFLSVHPPGVTLKAWSPETDDYEDVTGAVWSVDGVLFLQTDHFLEEEAMTDIARQTARDILLRHPPCLTEAPMGDLIEDIATAIVRG